MEDYETHLRLDRGVYGGVGFSRDLSLREWRERWHEEKTYFPGGMFGVAWNAKLSCNGRDLIV